MKDSLAYWNGSFVPVNQIAVSIEDLGFVMGVSVAERMRTFGGTLFRLDDHLRRLNNSLRIVELHPPESVDEIADIAERLAKENHARLGRGDDLGLTLFVTPGVADGERPTLAIHTYALPFSQWVQHYDQGQSLAEVGIRQVPASCWPAELKCRSRMHYYLADQCASRQYNGARAVLLDQDGFVSEASTANIVLFSRKDGIVSPPREKILPGVSLSVLVELAGQIGLPVTFRDFGLEQLAAADEVLLCSTSPCVWPAVELNGRAIGTGQAGPVYRQLLDAWGKLVGLNIAEQARRFAARPS